MSGKAFAFFLPLFLAPAVAQAQTRGSSTIRGQIIANPARLAAPMDVLLKKSGRRDVATVPDAAGKYAFHDLENSRYEIVVRSQGKEVRQRVELACGPNSTSVVDIVLDKNDTPSLIVYFPVEDPDVADLSELRRDYPKDVMRDYDKGRDDARAGNSGRAAERLESVVRRAPDFYAARARLGMLYQGMGCYREAEREYSQAQELSPRSAQPLVNLGSLFIQVADAHLDAGAPLDRARSVLEQAIQIKPTSDIAYCLLGTAYYKSGSYEEAEENLKHALEIKSRMVAARLMLANVYLRQEKWKDALVHLDAYLKDNPLAEDRDQIKRVRARVAENLKAKP